MRRFISQLALVSLVMISGRTALAGFPPSRTIEIAKPEPTTGPSPEPDRLSELTLFRGTLTEKLDQAEKLLSNLPLKVGDRDITYYEDRVVRSDSGWSTSRITRKEPEKEIGLALLNVKTGEISTVKITKKGDELISPQDFPVTIVERSNGIRWNLWNTQFRAPPGYIVLKNSYPDTPGNRVKSTVTDARGRKKTVYSVKVENFIYSPYSQELHVPELVAAGREHITGVVQRAFNELRKRKVPSESFPGKLVADVSVLRPAFFELLPVIEQTDMTEFILDPVKTSERVLVLIGSNPNVAFAKTGSPAGALGWVQYTPTTYSLIRRSYPAAKLTKDFSVGAPDHLTSMMAAILLYDHHLAQLIKKQGAQVVSDPRLEEYLAAAYNGGPSRVNKSLTASLAAQMADWVFNTKDETKGYVAKLRTLNHMWGGAQSAAQ